VIRHLDSKKIDELSDALAKQKQETLAAHEREENLRQEKEEEIATLRGEIDSSNTILAGLLLRADQAEAQAAARKEENERLRQEVQPVIDANPRLKAYVLSLNQTIADQGEAIVSLRFSLVEQERLVGLYQRQLQAQIEISESWKRQYEAEQALRIGFESSFLLSQRSLRKAKSREKWIAGAAGIGGALLGSWIGS